MREERGAQQGESESDPREELELRGASGVSKNLVRFQKRKKKKRKKVKKKKLVRSYAREAVYSRAG